MGALLAWIATVVPAAAFAAAPSVATVIAGTAHQALFGVAFDGDRGTAVGAAGQILLTDDAGKDWRASKQSGLTSLSLLGVDMRGDIKIAVGQAGLVLVSSGSDLWQQVESGTKERLFAVSLNSHGRAVAVGAFGTLLLSDDKGQSWRSIAAADTSQFSDQGADPHLYAVSVADSGTITVAGEFGLILRSQDEGAHWAIAHKGDASLFALSFGNDGTGYAVGQSGTILRSADAGTTWVAMPSQSQANLLAVAAGDDGRVLVTAMNSVLMSEDSGADWRGVQWGDFGSGWYAGVHFVGSHRETAILVGHAGRILQMNP